MIQQEEHGTECQESWILISPLLSTICLTVDKLLWGSVFSHIKWTLCLVHAQSCPILCNPMDCGAPGSSVHGIFQARILEWVVISSSRGSSWPRDRTHVSWVSCIGKDHCAAWEVLNIKMPTLLKFQSPLATKSELLWAESERHFDHQDSWEKLPGQCSSFEGFRLPTSESPSNLFKKWISRFTPDLLRSCGDGGLGIYV